MRWDFDKRGRYSSLDFVIDVYATCGLYEYRDVLSTWVRF